MFKPFIQSVHPYEPGKPIKELEREMGVRHAVKLASNENPLGPSRKALRAMRRAIREAHLYPEGGCPYLINRLSEELGVSTQHLIAGNGSNEIIELLMRGFVAEGDEVISSDLSFLVYPILTQVCGAKFVSVPATQDFRYDLKAILKAITPRTKIIFIANPNNPTGTYVTSSEINEFLSQVPANVLICFDEAYVDFVEAKDFPHTLAYVKAGRPNIVILRTFSKSYGLAGVRVGYGVSSPEVIAYLHKIRQPFNVNSIAQAAATAALDDWFFLWRTRKLVSRGRIYLYRRLKKLGLRYLESQANFVLFDSGHNADTVYQALLRKGVIVRSMRAYGLPCWIRVSVGKRSQNSLFYHSLRSLLKKGFQE